MRPIFLSLGEALHRGLVNSWSGRKASGRAATAGRRTRGPPDAASAAPASRARCGPTRSQKVPGGADAEAPRLTTSVLRPRRRLLAAALGSGPAGDAGRRQLTGGTAGRSRHCAAAGTGAGGTEAPLATATAALQPASPQRRSTCNGPSGFGEGRGAAGVPHLRPFWWQRFRETLFESVPLFLARPLPGQPERPPRSG